TTATSHHYVCILPCRTLPPPAPPPSPYTTLFRSKATNPAAAAASLRAAERVVWIAGGDAKGADLGPLIAAAHDRLVGVVLLGRDDAPFTAALSRHAPEVPVRRIDPGDTDGVAGRSRLMEDAVQAARAL